LTGWTGYDCSVSNLIVDRTSIDCVCIDRENPHYNAVPLDPNLCPS
jgi:hypothetical protein